MVQCSAAQPALRFIARQMAENARPPLSAKVRWPGWLLVASESMG